MYSHGLCSGLSYLVVVPSTVCGCRVWRGGREVRPVYRVVWAKLKSRLSEHVTSVSKPQVGDSSLLASGSIFFIHVLLIICFNREPLSTWVLGLIDAHKKSNSHCPNQVQIEHLDILSTVESNLILELLSCLLSKWLTQRRTKDLAIVKQLISVDKGNTKLYLKVETPPRSRFDVLLLKNLVSKQTMVQATLNCLSSGENLV